MVFKLLYNEVPVPRAVAGPGPPFTDSRSRRPPQPAFECPHYTIESQHRQQPPIPFKAVRLLTLLRFRQIITEPTMKDQNDPYYPNLLFTTQTLSNSSL